MVKRLARGALLVLSVVAIVLAWLVSVGIREADRAERLKDVPVSGKGYPMPVD